MKKIIWPVLAVLAVFVVSGCDLSSDGGSDSSTVTVDTEDTTGEFGPYVKNDGTVKFGTELGGGVFMDSSGNIDFGTEF